MKPRIAKWYLEMALKYPGDPLPSRIPNMMSNLSENFRGATVNRSIFESWMMEATLQDEPEAPPILCKNEVDDEPCPPWEFCYTNKMIYGHGIPKPKPIPKEKGCRCVGGCRSDTAVCSCAATQTKLSEELDMYGFLYNKEGKLLEQQLPVMECSDACGCAPYCMNRVSGSSYE